MKESFKLYKAVSEGVINLADIFFEMPYVDALRGLELYRESIASNEALSAYYASVEQIEEVRRSMQLPKLVAPPTDFAASMEAYLAEAPRPVDAAGAGTGAGPAKVSRAHVEGVGLTRRGNRQVSSREAWARRARAPPG